MKRILAVMTLCLMSACFDDPEELPLGVVDAGSMTGGGSGATGGGTSSGGGTATGGGSGGGTQLINDGGLIELANLPEASCGNRREFKCANDAGPCVTWETTSTDEVAVTSAELGAQRRIGGRIADRFMWIAHSGVDHSVLWSVSPSTAPEKLETTDTGTLLRSVHAMSAAPFGTTRWYVGNYVDVSANNNRFDVKFVRPSGTVSTSFTSASGPTSNGVAFGSNYAVAFQDGLYLADDNTHTRIVSLAAGELIVDVAVDDARTFIFYVRSDSTNGERLWRHEISTGTQTLMASMPRTDGVNSERSGTLTVYGGNVYVLGVLGVFHMPMTSTGTLELMFGGEAFPQYGGMMKARSLVRHGDALYFGKVCHFDADAPGYGTVELNLTQHSARWLDLDVNYPRVPHVAAYDAWEVQSPVYGGPTGVFILRD